MLLLGTVPLFSKLASLLLRRRLINRLLSALLVYTGTILWSLVIQGFSAINLGLVVIWSTLAFAIGREYVKLTSPVPQQRIPAA